MKVLSTRDCPLCPPKKFPQKPYSKSFIDQACSVKMTGYWPHSFFFGVFMDRDGIKVHEHAEKEVGQKTIFTIWQSSIEANLSVLIDSFLVGISPNYMASSVSGKEEPNRSLCRTGYRREQDEATLPDYPPCPARKIFPKAK